LSNPHDAADVAQSSFERVDVHGLSAAIASPRALLFRTAQRICIDAARHRQVARRWQETEGVLRRDAGAVSAEQLASDRQTIETIVQRLKRMPARRRDVFLLFRVYGYSRREIARRLAITEATVAKHVVRATLDCARAFADLKDE
jgi:RNA polymerase sigma factor (sigma-70 family)